VLFALVGLGALATLLSVREERQSVRLVDQRAADLAASQIRGALASTIGSLRGADALATDGSVGREEFDAFATNVITDSLFQAIALAEVVDEADRADFEARTGLTIRDTDGQGGFLPGTVRSRSLVVTMVTPIQDSNRAVLGFDIASDPIRLDAAIASERTGLPAMSDRISTATQARPGVAIVSPIRRPDGSTIGFLSSGLDIEVVLERAGVDASSFEEFGLDLDGVPLVGNAATGSTQTFDIAEHQVAVTVHTGTGFNALLPTIIGVGTLLLLAAVTAAARRDRHQRERIALSARRSSAINELGHSLAAATDVTSIVDEVLRRGGGIMDAGHVGIALRDADHPSRVVLRYDASVPADMGRRLADTDVDAARPFSECVRDGVEVVVPNRDTLAERFPHAMGDADTARIESLIWVPLLFGRELRIGALGFTWPEPMSGATLEERRVAANTVADLTSRSLERAITATTVQLAADNLGELARGLAGSHDPGDVQVAVRTHAAAILGAQTAELVLGPTADHEVSAAALERTIGDRSGVPIARLVLRWRRPMLLGAAQSAVFDTMVEIIGQTLERTALTEQEHQVIVQLQRDLLRPPPALRALDVAVRYQPAMSVLGLGGDFYDVIAGDDEVVFVVIGDVTGHGSEAVAAMAELKAVTQSLLRGGRGLETVCEEADLLLARRGMYATVQIAELDSQRRTMRLVNAGHPYPVLRRAGGEVELLTGGHRPLLGLGGASSSPTPAAMGPFEPGDALLLYTDGLIERRSQSIDTGMQVLVDLLTEHGGHGTSADLVDQVVTASQAPGNGDRTDDDMALLVVRLRSDAADGE
jgi:serine phosphatase RsbU (regulator of sigma subunit)